MSTLYNNIKRVLRKPSLLKVLIFGAVATPTNPGRVMVDLSPQGLKLVHTAGTVSEAGWLTQVLRDAGFTMQYVPSASTGIFGTSGNSSIYVIPDEYDEALEFLNQYLAGEAESDDR